MDNKSAEFDSEDVLRLFNLQSTDIESLSVSRNTFQLIIFVTLARMIHCCPVCGAETDRVKGYTLKKITHSIITSYPCVILYRARRYVCPVCGKTFYEDNPFVFEGSRISFATVCNVLRDLKSPSETFTSVAKRYSISPTTAQLLFDRYVTIPRRTLPEYLMIDECYAFSSSESGYVCVLADAVTGTIIDILPTRRQDHLENYFSMIPGEEKARVKVLSGDMWETYYHLTVRCLRNSCYAADRFHIVQELMRRVTAVRIRIMKQYKPYKDKPLNDLPPDLRREYVEKSQKYYLLRKFGWIFFKQSDDGIFDPNNEKRYNHKFSCYLNIYDIREKIFDIDDDLIEIYNLKFRLDRFYRDSSYDRAAHDLRLVIEAFDSSPVPEMNAFAKTLKRWRKSIVNSFIIIDDKGRRISNSLMENRNGIIKQIKKNGFGFTSWERYRKRLLYCLNSDANFYIPYNKLKGNKKEDDNND